MRALFRDCMVKNELGFITGKLDLHFKNVNVKKLNSSYITIGIEDRSKKVG
jgi:hypothetical protein